MDTEVTALHTLTAGIVSAFVSNNPVQSSQLPEIVASVHAALQNVGTPVAPVAEKLEPRMPIKKTITPDYLVSLEDGKHYKSLKRHLSTHGLTPEQYRTKWGLPADYPMVAPSYSAARSALAQSMGLGQQRRKEAAPEPEAPAKAPSKSKRKKGDNTPAPETAETPADPAPEADISEQI